MKKGGKYIIEIDEVIEDESGKRYAKIKGFNTLIFDYNGLSKLRAVDDSDLKAEGNKEAWNLARRVAGTPSDYLVDIGLCTARDIEGMDEYEVSCNVLCANEFNEVKEKFDITDKQQRQSISVEITDLINRLNGASHSNINDKLIDVLCRIKMELDANEQNHTVS